MGTWKLHLHHPSLRILSLNLLLLDQQNQTSSDQDQYHNWSNVLEHPKARISVSTTSEGKTLIPFAPLESLLYFLLLVELEVLLYLHLFLDLLTKHGFRNIILI